MQAIKQALDRLASTAYWADLVSDTWHAETTAAVAYARAELEALRARVRELESENAADREMYERSRRELWAQAKADRARVRELEALLTDAPAEPAREREP
jgi:predicted DNA-binding protein (UPF0251 family)